MVGYNHKEGKEILHFDLYFAQISENISVGLGLCIRPNEFSKDALTEMCRYSNHKDMTKD